MPTIRSGAAIREAFLAYFEQTLGHRRLPSASLVPAKNPTVLLTPAGMLPFVPIFLGLEPRPNPPRVTASQKCARVSGKASDLEAVGRTPRHHTFFEMLGNFSFGDYFKAEVIPWAWTFLTEVLGIPQERLWVSVFREDDEAYAIWRDKVGVPEARIFRCDEADNFWGPPGPTGPCGPCSEIHYDFTQNPDDPLDVRLLEIWNLVFMEFFKDEQGQLTPLEHKNVDTGMGLERIAMVMQEVNNTFETDLFTPIMEAVSKKAGIAYGAAEASDIAIKIVADHLRFLAFALADGVLPSNEGRGYIARMILRRAVRYGRQYLGFSEPVLAELLPVVSAHFGEAYPELRQRESHSQTIIQREETRFLETVEKGSLLLEKTMADLKAKNSTILSGDEAFRLYDTYGFPLELTQDVLAEHGLELDKDGYEAALQAQRTLARQNKKSIALVGSTAFSDILAEVGETRFVGYDSLEVEATVKALLVDGEPVSQVNGTNQPFQAILDVTPFYAESGGQVGDQGHFLDTASGQQGLTVLVKDTQKLGDLIVHECLFDQGEALRVGDKLTACVEPKHRLGTMLHHSATHLVHSALRQILGPEVGQAGSWVGSQGARFDFSFPRAVSAVELNKVEALVNNWIWEDAASLIENMSLDEAKAAGAVAMFDEKYGETVRVISFGGYSKELCGGTHVANVAQIGLFRFTSEGGIASGVRRVEYVVGAEAYRAFKQEQAELKRISGMLKASTVETADRVEKLLADIKQRDKALDQLKAKQALQFVETLISEANTLTPPVAIKLLPEGTSPDAMKALAEAVMDKAQNEALGVFLASSDPEAGKVMFVCALSKELVSQGLKAGDLVKVAAERCGGGGGGRPNFAQAGGKDASRLNEALEAVGLALQEVVV